MKKDTLQATPPQQPASDTQENKAWRIVFYLVGILSVLIWLGVLIGGVRGFDLSDNGFYMLSLSNLEHITIDTWWYASLLIYLYQLAGENMVVLRLMGMILMLWGTFTFTFVSLSTFFPHQGRWQRGTFVLTATTAGVLYYRNWLVTPSYNWLTLIGVIVTGCGLLIWLTSEHTGRARWGAIVLGMGVMLVAWGKLTSMALLSIVLLVALPVTAHNFQTWQRLHWRWWWLPVVGAGVVMLAGISQETSLNNWLDKLGQGYQYQTLIRDNERLLFASFVIQPLESISHLLRLAMMSILPALAGLAIVWLSRQRKHPQRWYRLIMIVYIPGLFWITIAIRSSMDVGRWAVGLYLLTLASVLVARRVQNDPTSVTMHAPVTIQHIRLYSLGLALLPIVVSYGTRNYVAHIGTSAYFLVLAALVWVIQLQGQHAQRLQRMMLLGIALASGLVMFITAQTPYRQDAPVWALQTRVTLRQGRESVLVSDAQANYLRTLQTTATTAGFEAGMPLIDWTGHSPGAVYALDGEVYGFMWLLGGYAGSDDAARFALQTAWTDAQRQTAWLLTSDGDRALSDDVLREVGVNFPEGYEALGQFVLPFFGETHTLWRPVDDG